MPRSISARTAAAQQSASRNEHSPSPAAGEVKRHRAEGDESMVADSAEPAALNTSSASSVPDVVALNVGGVRYSALRSTLLAQESSFFTSLLATLDSHRQATEAAAAAGVDDDRTEGALATVTPVDVDETGAVLIDRDGEAFRHVLNYLRGYPKPISLTKEDAAVLLDDACYYALPGFAAMLTADPALGVQPPGTITFEPGPGINAEGTRVRTSYVVNFIGEGFILAGRHTITFSVLAADYLGIGVVSDQCTSRDTEFHRVANSVVYYMTGVFYTNCPTHRKDDGFGRRYTAGDQVTVTLDMTHKTVEFFLNAQSVKIASVATAARLRFAVAMKQDSAVRIVPNPPELCAERSVGVEDAAGARSATPL